MNTPISNSHEKEDQLTLGLLQAIDSKDDISQRHLAQEMGVALGLANSYLKRCVKKGWIKITTAPANRYLYYLTPMGFAQKARLTSEFLSTSLTLFRQSGDDYDQLLSHCDKVGYRRIVFAGISDLTEIAYLRTLQAEVEVVGVFQPQTSRSEFFDIPVRKNVKDCSPCDCVLMTSLEQTNELLTLLTPVFDVERVLVPTLLLNMQYRSHEDDAGQVKSNQSIANKNAT